MTVLDTFISGDMFDKEKDRNSADDGKYDIRSRVCKQHCAGSVNEEGSERVVQNFDDMMSGWFKCVQTEDGSAPAVFHNNEDDLASINFKYIRHELIIHYNC